MLTEIDIYRSPNALIHEHGEGAEGWRSMKQFAVDPEA